MVQAVAVTQFRADDGSLHGTEAQARRRNERLVREAETGRIEAVVRKPVEKRHFWSVSEHIAPYDGHDFWSRDVERARDEFVGELATLIVEHWDDLKKAMGR
jgi:hypothetical protein